MHTFNLSGEAMKSHKLIYICILAFIIIFGVFVLYQRLLAQSAFKAFLKEAHIKSSDIIYESKEKPFLDDGLILHDVEFPQLKIAHKIDKLVIRKDEEDTILQFQGAQINIPQTLQTYYGESIIHAIKTYHPFEDALTKPFISLGLMGIDTLKCDIVLIFNPKSKPIFVNSKISMPKLGDMQLSFTIHPQMDSGFRKNLIYTGYGTIEQVSVDIQDAGLFKAYAHYLLSLGTPESMAYAKELMKHSGFTRHFKFTKQPTLVPFYHTQRIP